MKCTNAVCEEDATRIMAVPPSRHPNSPQCYYAAPYCDEHAEEVAEMGGLPVAGPSLSREAAKIEGIR